MYNYFMLIGIVEGIISAKTSYVELRVERMFGKGADHFKLRLLEPLDTLTNEIHMAEPLTIKGRILTHTDGSVELVAERIIFMRGSK